MRARAFTLPELLVSLGLGALVLSLLVALVIWGMRVYTVQSLESQRFQLSAMAMRRLHSDLRASCAEGVSLLDTPSRCVIAIHPLADLTSTGEQVWSDRLVVYLWTDNRLVRGTFGPAPSTSRPQRLSPDQLRTLTPEGSVVLLDQLSAFRPRLQGRTLSLDLETTYRVPYRKDRGRQEFHSSQTLRDNP